MFLSKLLMMLSTCARTLYACWTVEEPVTEHNAVWPVNLTTPAVFASNSLKPENADAPLVADQSKSSLYLFICRVCKSTIACSKGVCSLYDPAFKYWPSHSELSSCKHNDWFTFNAWTVNGATSKVTSPASVQPQVVPVWTESVSESKLTFCVPLQICYRSGFLSSTSLSSYSSKFSIHFQRFSLWDTLGEIIIFFTLYALRWSKSFYLFWLTSVLGISPSTDIAPLLPYFSK